MEASVISKRDTPSNNSTNARQIGDLQVVAKSGTGEAAIFKASVLTGLSGGNPGESGFSEMGFGFPAFSLKFMTEQTKMLLKLSHKRLFMDKQK